MSTPRTVLSLILALAVSAIAVPAAQAASDVMPPNAKPAGYSLERMAAEHALFVSSGNDPAYYPQTPFQVLFASSLDAAPEGDGLVVSGQNTLEVQRSTRFYLPILQVNDSPPVIGTFPSAPGHAATAYFFGSSQVGAEPAVITIDGDTTTIGASYLAGPVKTPTLFDGGNHIMTLGAFLKPLKRGTHTIHASGSVSGDAFSQTFGLSFLRFEFTYTVTVD
jgi:hypothetical protein